MYGDLTFGYFSNAAFWKVNRNKASGSGNEPPLAVNFFYLGKNIL